MRAWTVEKVGHPPELRDVAMPEPGPGQVRLRVTATGLNFADLLMIKGTYQETPTPPFAPGLEVAGVVDKLGPGTSDLKPGQRVAGYAGRDGLSNYVVLSVDRCLPIDDQMDDITAAGFQIAYGTSHLALHRRARLKDGEALLVLGAAGGVGLTAVEIGKAMGARVVAVARGADRLAIAKAAGADVLIDSAETDDLRSAFKAAGPFDVIYDAIGGEMAEAALRATAPEARHLLIGFAGGDLPTLKPNHLLVKNTDVLGVYWGGYMTFAPKVLRDGLIELTKWHAEGRIHPHVSHTLPFDKALEAIDLLKSRKSTGKIVVTQ